MSWTLRPQRTTFRGSNPSAVNRAKRMIRRHANEFHGAGVEDAVQELTVLKEFTDTVRNMRVGLAKLSEALNKPITNDGDAVVGWRSPSGLLLCPEHSHANGTPLTAAELPSDATCAVCSEELTP